ncbi:MAG: hypothetical protein KA020_10750 [Planctomycetes bacterium]|mgnify:CR=1 FL=1|jgi:hypothetical protein|nr:hypothetical protein [Planctomycetota bacterium]MCC7061321.1 hypothetical protein [Planctomycetota bacterium]
MRIRPILVALALTATLLPAQAVGTEAPDIAWSKTFVFGDIPNQKLSDLRGSVVLLEFWGTH